MDVAILIYDGFDDLDAIGPHEAFSHARTAGADLTVTVATLAPQDVVESCHGLRVEPDGILPERPDLVVVPGGGWTEAEGKLSDALVGVHDRGATLASVCTGGVLLARAGIAEDRPAVTHQGALGDLEVAGADVVEARVVDDGDLVTAGGVTAGLDLAIHLLEREFGSGVADRVAETLEYEPRGDVHRA